MSPKINPGLNNIYNNFLEKNAQKINETEYSENGADYKETTWKNGDVIYKAYEKCPLIGCNGSNVKAIVMRVPI